MIFRHAEMRARAPMESNVMGHHYYKNNHSAQICCCILYLVCLLNDAIDVTAREYICRNWNCVWTTKKKSIENFSCLLRIHIFLFVVQIVVVLVWACGGLFVCVFARTEPIAPLPITRKRKKTNFNTQTFHILTFQMLFLLAAKRWQYSNRENENKKIK